ncbi:MAG: ATP-binding protein [Chloroflexota bacterium]
MFITEIVFISIALLTFGLMLVLAMLRIRSQETIILHLALYAGLGLVLGLSLLLARLSLTLPIPGISYRLTTEFVLLAMMATFGALTFNLQKKEPKYLIVFWASSVIVLALWFLLLFNFQAQNSIAGPPAKILSGLGWVAAIATVLTTLSLDFRKRQPAQYVNRLRYWLIGIILLGAGGVIFYANAAIFNWAGLPPIVVGSIIAAYTVLSYHTPDLRLLTGRALRYSGSMGILAAIFLLGLAVVVSVSRYVPDTVDVAVWAIVLSIVIANLYPPLWRLSHRLLTRIIFGKHSQDQRQIIKHYSQSIGAALDMKRLGDTVINLMIETLGLEKGIVFVNERHGGGNIALRPLSSVGTTDDLSTGQISPDSPLVDYFRKGKRVVSQYDIDVLPEFRLLPKKERTWLSGLGMELFVPILRQRDFVGLLAFGPQAQGTAYYEEDTELMITLADQTAMALDGARLFEQLAMVNQEVGLLTEQLAEVDDTKSDFLSIASHELRTPLTQIHGYSQMLLDVTEEELRDPSYVKTLIEGVVKGSERMKGVVDLMFDVTEADVGEMRLFKGQVNLEDVIEQAAQPFLTALDERRIAFGKVRIKELPVIEADGTRLVQAFENLIGNAIKYTPDGGTVTIEGRLSRLDKGEPAVEIIVTDTGIGIDPEHQERIFEKFFRVGDTLHHSTGKTKFKGAGPGLGLSLVKGIAEAHGGKVWVESLGHDEINYPGSKFFFVLPTSAKVEALPRKQSEIETRHWRRSDLFPDEDE